MHIFAGQTMIQNSVIIRRERSLSRTGEIVVRLGQDVTPVQVVARASQRGDFYVIPAAEKLAVPAQEIEKYVLVEEGAAILKGTPLLRKKGLFSEKQFFAPADGVLYAISHGRLILQQTPDLLEMRAMLFGRVHSLVPNRGVIIETIGSLIQAVWCSGREGSGKLLMMVDRPEELLRSNYIDASARGAILVAGRLDNLEVLNRAAEGSARGVIVGSVPAALVSGIKEIGLPVFVTDGFGDRPMATPLFSLLQQLEDHEACLLDNSQFNRPGRPEIIVPLPVEGNAELPDMSLKRPQKGQQVRILQAPYAGQVGQIVTVYNRARLLDNGLRLPGADIRLVDGQVVYIPYLNLDLIG
jgi:hypothetical protein